MLAHWTVLDDLLLQDVPQKLRINICNVIISVSGASFKGCIFYTLFYILKGWVVFMPRKQKHRLPSGSVRLQAYDYTDENGKKHYKSFTAPTLAEAKAMRSEWQLERKRGQKKKDNCDLTVQEAVRRYIDAKDGALSPGTIRGYESLYNVRFCGQFGKLHLDELDDEGVQIWISDLSRHLSPKTVSNTYGLFLPAIKMFQKHVFFDVTLPAKERPELYCPSDSDVKTFIQSIASDPELERAVLLAAFGPLRRGEICALTDKDIRGNIVIVNKSRVRDKNGQWLIKKTPKTYASNRHVEFPTQVIERLSGIKGYLVPTNPDAIAKRFKRALSRSGLPEFRFHDFRHYSASIMHAIGVPDQYIIQRGGWQTDNMMKAVYRDAISEEAQKQTIVINQHFALISSGGQIPCDIPCDINTEKRVP